MLEIRAKQVPQRRLSDARGDTKAGPLLARRAASGVAAPSLLLSRGARVRLSESSREAAASLERRRLALRVHRSGSG